MIDFHEVQAMWEKEKKNLLFFSVELDDVGTYLEELKFKKALSEKVVEGLSVVMRHLDLEMWKEVYGIQIPIKPTEPEPVFEREISGDQ